MRVVPAKFPFSVADGEGVELCFSEGDLVIRFVDWRARRVEHCFHETLAFRWSARATIEMPRDDSAYEVLESPWLIEALLGESAESPADFVRNVLCFNAEKVLEVICRRTG